MADLNEYGLSFVKLVEKCMAKTDYRCKDCVFFLNETCKHSDEYRTTIAENIACNNFEYKHILK